MQPCLFKVYHERCILNLYMATSKPILILHARIRMGFFWSIFFVVIFEHFLLSVFHIIKYYLGFWFRILSSFFIQGYDLMQYVILLTLWWLVQMQYLHQLYQILHLKVPPPIQDESGDVSEWAHKSSRWFCKVDACISSYAAKWLLCQHLEQTHSFRMQAEKSRHPSTHHGGLGNKITVL